jgi:hypothetical protein
MACLRSKKPQAKPPAPPKQIEQIRWDRRFRLSGGAK